VGALSPPGARLPRGRRRSRRVSGDRERGVGADPVAFPEIESGYDLETAKAEAARCYRCDAETGSNDYSVAHREDIFSMARTNPNDGAKLRAMRRG
jgi:hypothetical protein